MNIGDMNRIKAMLPLLNERQKRLFLANEAGSIGYGGVSRLSRVSGVSRITITNGIKELAAGEKLENTQRIRKSGGGRKKMKIKQPDIKTKLEELLEPYTKGDPCNPLKYSGRSLRNLERELKNLDYQISHTTVRELLKEEGYSLQANRKEPAGSKEHPERNEQFEYINRRVKAFGRKGAPVLSIDAKKKEMVGNFKNGGKEYHKKQDAPLVYDHDFVSFLGKATPFGVYDIFKNTGFVNVGISADTAEFAVESLRK
jgi:transposase